MSNDELAKWIGNIGAKTEQQHQDLINEVVLIYSKIRELNKQVEDIIKTLQEFKP